MKTMACTQQYVASMTAMPSSSNEQNQALKEKLKMGLSLSCCYVKIWDDQVVCRIIKDEKHHYLGSFTVEDIDQKEIDTFLKDVVQSLDHNQEWRCDLYSDKVHYEKIYDALHQCFPIEIQRESYVSNTQKENLTEFMFGSVKRESKETLLNLMKRASATTLDQLIQRDLQRSPQALADMMQDFLDDEESEALFQILYVEQVAVGFVCVQRLLHDIGGIGYLGVDPDMQGKHYGVILLKKAKDMAFQMGIHKLIGDIDVRNFAIRGNLLQSGFALDCRESVFFLDINSNHKTVDKQKEIK